MGEETITVGEISRGDAEGTPVELPVVDVLTGRSFVTGKSGSGKSNTASVICEKLLDKGFGILIVDIDGEYYGLKEEYEILHVGGDEECDLQVTEEHAGKIAELALEQNVPIILDVSSFLDESEARALLTEVTKHLFAKEKKVKQPFLMLVEEIHEYIPEGGGVDECGRMLIKVSKRGRKHGLGIVGISQRPADVKKDFITQCDWLVWHRLTWNNDTKVVGRILGNEYADHIEEMDDGECFLMTDWAENIRVVQFERKKTFDAGATPGLDDFERPELKSVSGDLVQELEEISETQERRENRIEELERELKQKDERIRDLERQLKEAQDLKKMADRFSRAMMEQVTGRPLSAAPGRQSELDEVAGPVRRDPELEAELEAIRNGEKERESSPVPVAGSDDGNEAEPTEDGEPTTVSDRADSDSPTEPASDTKSRADSESSTSEDDAFETSDWPAETDAQSFGFGGIDRVAGTDTGETDGDDSPTVSDVANGSAREPTASPALSGGERLVDRLRSEIAALDDTAVEMLRAYRDHGPMTPQEAHEAAGGSGDRTGAYSMNRQLRERGFVAHASRGRHEYALPSLVAEETVDPFNPDQPVDGTEHALLVQAVESAFVEGVDAPETVDATAEVAADGGTDSSN
ncbi:helicase HerA domain-containing protein [Natronomonas amylolytica]|uniref:helicase HerA domain-containing protein n=1 Tax=Natronomonas amylolytica TaxID=3108498 RepID=UPI003009967A